MDNTSIMLYIVANNKCLLSDSECRRAGNKKCKVLEDYCICCPIDSYERYCDFYGFSMAYYVYVKHGIN